MYEQPSARVKHYRKKAVHVKAMHFASAKDAFDIALWCGGRVREERKTSDPTDIAIIIDIPTLDGPMQAFLGDYVVRGENGGFYSCKGPIFLANYESALRGRD